MAPTDDELEIQRARQEFIDAQAGLEAAAVELRAVLRKVETATRRGRRHLERGGLAIEVPVVADVAAVRIALSEKIAGIEAARKVSRMANMRTAALEGASASEIARRYGLSRQYVSKMLHGEE